MNISRKSIVAAFFLGLAYSEGATADTTTDGQFATAIERTARITSSCVPSREHLRYGEIHAVTFAGRREPGTELTVEVEASSGPVHLFLYAHMSVVWRLSIEPGARLATLYVMGPAPSDVTDIPEYTQVYSVGHDENVQHLAICSTGDPLATAIANATLRYSWSPLRHRHLEEMLETYASQTFASLVLIEPDATTGAVSQVSIRRTRQIRAAGAAVMRHVSLPGEPRAHDETVILPQELSSTEIHDWLLQTSVAEIAGEEVLDFLCLLEQAEYWAVGMGTALFEPWCEAREIWDGSQQLVLTSSIDLGGTYNCEGGLRVVLYIPRYIEVAGRFVNCNVHLWRYEG